MIIRKALREYWSTNQGLHFITFNTEINKCKMTYDIYWGDPEIIFDKNELAETLPLAVTLIPHIMNLPDSRIFLHNKLRREYGSSFDFVVAHEIGHIWLHDVVGANHHRNGFPMDLSANEKWADYFAYSYFNRFRQVSNLSDMINMFDQLCEIHSQIYDKDPKEKLLNLYKIKIKDLSDLEKTINIGLKAQISFCAKMVSAINITLDSLGDILK